MPIRPRSGRRQVVRHRKSCFNSSALGCLKLKTSQPSGLTPDMTCRTVFAGGVHALKNQQERIAAGRVVKALQGTQFLNVFFKEFFVPLVRLAQWLHHRRPLFECDLLSGPHAEIVRIDSHRHPFSTTSCTSCRTLVVTLVSAPSRHHIRRGAQPDCTGHGEPGLVVPPTHEPPCPAKPPMPVAGWRGHRKMPAPMAVAIGI